MEHRFLHDHRENIKTFASGQLKNIDNLATLLPDLNWQQERQYFFISWKWTKNSITHIEDFVYL